MQFVAAQLSNYHIKAHPKHGTRSRTLTLKYTHTQSPAEFSIVELSCRNATLKLFCFVMV